MIVEESKAPSVLRSRAFESPIVVLGSGGSGTRVVWEVIHRAGVFGGRMLNHAYDSVPFHMWALLVFQQMAEGRLDRRLIRCVADTAVMAHLPVDVIEAIAEGRPLRWMIKCPRLIHLVPMLYNVFPWMKMIHVVRDGRDMAFTSNLQTFKSFGKQEEGEPLPVAVARFWEKWNGWAVDRAETLSIDRLVVKIEDLCDDPRKEADRLTDFLGLDKVSSDVLQGIARQPTFGRWRGHEHERAVEDACRAGLERFGYLEAKVE